MLGKPQLGLASDNHPQKVRILDLDSVLFLGDHQENDTLIFFLLGLSYTVR